MEWVGDDSLITQLVHYSPVFVRDGKPLTVTRPYVDVDGAEIIVLLMA